MESLGEVRSPAAMPTSVQQLVLGALVDRQQAHLRVDIESWRLWFGRAHSLVQAIARTPPSAMSDVQRTALVAQFLIAVNEANTLLARIRTGPSIVASSSYQTARAAPQKIISSSTVASSSYQSVRAAPQKIISSSTVASPSYKGAPKVQPPHRIGGI